MKKKLLTTAISLIVLLVCALSLVGCSGKKYKITLDADGGVVEKDYYAFNTGDVIKDMPIPQKDGKTFIHWVVDGSNVILREGETLNFRANLSAKALYKGENEIYIGYDLDGGKFEGETKYIYDFNGQDYTIPTPIRVGYKFVGWQGVGEGVSSSLTLTSQNKNDIQIKAVWQEKNYTVNINFTAYRYILKNNVYETERLECSINSHKSYTVVVPYSKAMEMPRSNPRADDDIIAAEYVFRYYFVFNDQGNSVQNITRINKSTIFNSQTVGDQDQITLNVMFGFGWTDNH